MIEINSVIVILMAEALAALFLFVLVFMFFAKRKKSNGEVSASDLIDKVEVTEHLKVKNLQKLIQDNCSIEPDVLDALLKEITSNERILYQQIIQLFLKKDSDVLNNIDEHIDNLSEPFCKLLIHSSSNEMESGKSAAVEDKLQRLMQENSRLSEQLSVAMNTMDEISAEYTRVFSGRQTELELENSSKKMFEIFNTAEQEIKEQSKDAEAKEL